MNSHSRREFLQTATLASAFALKPHATFAQRTKQLPSDSLRIAGIGVGGMGAVDLNALAPGNQIVALCDVDEKRAAETFQKFSGARRFQDFRKMFDAMENEIDAVVVATPDHTHAVAAMAAIKRGKHVYCEKPLAHSVHEIRALMKAARKHNVVTQLGNQGHSFDSIRKFCEWIWAGAIGDVHTIHAGCAAVNSGIEQLPSLQNRVEVPINLNWDLWLGPAMERPYSPAYLPGSWRGWVPFGGGTIGDWICHVVDPVFWALDLGAPGTVRADVKDYNLHTQQDAYPKGEIVTFEFPARGNRKPITLHWYTGTQRIPRPPELDANQKDIETGAVVVGTRGTIVYGSHGAGGVRLIPEARMKEFSPPSPSLPRVKNHHEDWLQAVRKGGRAGSDFDYGGPLTEIAMLGIIAIKNPGETLQWDGDKGRFRNHRQANALLEPPYRKGWTL